MSARVIHLTSESPRAGKTHFAAAMARWLVRHGHSVEVLHLGDRGLARVTAADGSILSRPAAILAEAAMVESGGRHEDRTALETLAEKAEFVIVESAVKDTIRPVDSDLQLSRDGDEFRLEGYGRLPVWKGRAIVPEVPQDVAEMEKWSVGGWPRVGVITLPNLSNFSDFQILRGSEWIAAPPVGRFATVFIPASSDPVSDRTWMEEQGLAAWLDQQRKEGCRVIATGWPYAGAEVIDVGELQNSTSASRLVGRRLDPSLPSEETMDDLGGWIGSWSRWKSLFERLQARVVK